MPLQIPVLFVLDIRLQSHRPSSFCETHDSSIQFFFFFSSGGLEPDGFRCRIAFQTVTFRSCQLDVWSRQYVIAVLEDAPTCSGGAVLLRLSLFRDRQLWWTRAPTRSSLQEATTLLHVSGRHVMGERTRRHQASPSRAGTAGRTSKVCVKGSLDEWSAVSSPWRLCVVPLHGSCEASTEMLVFVALRLLAPTKKRPGCRGMLHADQQGQLFSKTHVHTQFFGSGAGRSAASTRYAPKVAQCGLLVFFS